LCRVPLITVFTKYDLLVDEVQFNNHLEFHKRSKNLDPAARDALLVKETNEMFETLCVRPFKAVVGPDVPHIAVSSQFLTKFSRFPFTFANAAKKDYNDSKKTLKDLTALTAKYVKECLAIDVAKEVAVLSAVAQRVNPAMKIDAVIE
jgi:hypothetical protein